MTVNRIEQAAVEFANFLGGRGLIYEPHVQADLLASILGSQFVLFAGPSGTGKSTAAAALAEFFSPADRRSTLRVERTWESPSDVTGAFSSFADYFVKKPGLDSLMAIRRHAGGTAESSTARTPIIVVEEANLSPIEGYLNPIVHGLSSPAVETIPWPLHSVSAGARLSGDTAASAEVPPILDLGPWVRVLGTINVDHTAIAPARKVSGRACVVLLEPMDNPSSEDGISALWEGTTGAGAPAPTSSHAILHDPRTALGAIRNTVQMSQLAATLDGVVAELRDAVGTNPVSKRDEQRCLLFMAFFNEVAAYVPGLDLPPADRSRVAAENALLHFVLPGLAPEDFARTIEHFFNPGVPSLLRTRCSRLGSSDADTALGYSIDFWAALS